MPDASWPNLPGYKPFTAQDHADHSSPRGIAYPENIMGTDSAKATKALTKAVSKPHLKLAKGRKGHKRRKKYA